MATGNTLTALTEAQLAILSQDILVGFARESEVSAYTIRAIQDGMLRKGQTIKAPIIPAIGLEDYDGDDITIAGKTVTSADLTVDHTRSWAFALDRIDEEWVKNAIQTGMLAQAGYEIANDMNAKFLANYANVAAANKIDATSFKSGTSANDAIVPSAAENSDYYVGKILAKAARILSDNYVPKNDRVIFVPPFFTEKLIQANLTKLDAPEVVKQQTTINGFVARL